MVYLQLILSLALFTNAASTDRPLTVENLSQKWALEKYRVFYFSEDPADNERNDYIEFRNDGTFASISEGEFSKGNWTLNQDEKRISMTDGTSGALVFIIEKLTRNKLVLIIDDPSDEDAQYLEIHFKRAN